jgi:prepilin-type processing-associated H-X9-DG protein
MKAATRDSVVRRGPPAYTLIELLCSIGIVVLLAAMLLPALRKGYAKTQRLYCVSNLHQTGLAFHNFAHAHYDRFPMQVPTDDGGSLEYLQAANTMPGEFYFSYRHFLPLSNDLAVPKVLGCPTDTRRPATNFATLQNENLSYFVAGTPEFGNPNSVLAGNRNVAPAYGSIARVGGHRRLMWTEELHRFKGNVLFSDGHVEQLNDIFNMTNSGLASTASLHMPSIRPTPGAGYGNYGDGPSYPYGGSVRPGGQGLAPTVCAVTNQVGSNLVVSWQVSGGRRKGALLAFPPGGDAGAGGFSPPPGDANPARSLAAPMAATARVNKPDAADWSPKGIYRRVIAKGQELVQGAALIIYDVPWYLLLLLIAALLELRRRVRARQKRLAANRRWHETTTHSIPPRRQLESS